MEIENFELEISNYEVIGDPQLSDSHIFEIKVWITPNYYTIKRTYSNFIDFDIKIRKMFPKSSIIECPLQPTQQNNNKLLKQVKKNSQHVVRYISTNEIVSNKRNALLKYLEDILEKP